MLEKTVQYLMYLAEGLGRVLKNLDPVSGITFILIDNRIWSRL